MFKEMKKGMFLSATLVALAAATLLGGCAKDTKPSSKITPQEGGGDVFYAKETFILPSDNVETVRFAQNGVWFLESRADADNFVTRGIRHTRFEEQDMGTAVTEDFTLKGTEEDSTLLQFFTDDTGVYTVCLPTDAQGTKALVLNRYDLGGKLLLSGDIAVSNLSNPDAIKLVKVGGDRGTPKLYLKIGSELVVLDESDSLKETERLDVAETMDIVSDGERVWCIESRAGGISIYDVEEREDTMDLELDCVCACCAGQFIYLSDGIALYEIDTVSRMCRRVLQWTDCGINGHGVEGLSVSEGTDGSGDGSIAGIEKDVDRAAVFILRESGDAGDIITLRIATTNPNDPTMRGYISGFVDANPQYRIEVMDLSNGDGYVSVKDAMLRLNMAVISGNPPDLVDMYSVDFKNYADKGVFEDLYAYLDGSDELDRSLFIENVMKCYETDGKLNAIPTCFDMSGEIAKERIVGSQPVWTVDEIMRILEENDGMTLTYFGCQGYLIEMSKDDFLDEENGTCNFDSEEFKKILECEKKHPLQDALMIDEMDLFMQDRILVCNELVDSVLSLQFVNQLYNEKIKFVEVTLQGEGAYGICATSTQKEDAWKFVEFVLSSKPEQYLPSRQDYLDELIDAVKTPEYKTDAKGEYVYDDEGERVQIPKQSIHYTTASGAKYDINVYAATEEEIEQLMECIQCATLVDYDHWEIDYIIREEAEAYYAGDKSVDEVAEIIQNRVQNYLREQ